MSKTDTRTRPENNTRTPRFTPNPTFDRAFDDGRLAWADDGAAIVWPNVRY